MNPKNMREIFEAAQ